jgi:hypothetical protein
VEQTTFTTTMHAATEAGISKVYRPIEELTDDEFAKTAREPLSREMAAYVGEVQRLTHLGSGASKTLDEIERLRPDHVRRTYDVLAAECRLDRLPEEHQQIVRQSLRLAFSEVAIAYMELALQIAKDEAVSRGKR